MGLYQVSSNNSPGVKFDPTLGVTSFTWDYIEKTLEISLYLANIAQSIAVRSNLAPAWESQVLHGLIQGKLPNLPVSSNKALAYQILHVALSGEPLQRVSKS